MRSLALALLLIPILTRLAAAQDTLVPGARVRLVARELRDRLTGSVISVARDTVIVRSDPTWQNSYTPNVFAARSSELEVRIGSRRNGERGTTIGAATLGFVGFFLATPLDRSCSRPLSERRSCDYNFFPSIGMGAFGALVGAGAGGIIGSAFKSDIWAPVAGAGSIGLSSRTPTAVRRRTVTGAVAGGAITAVAGFIAGTLAFGDYCVSSATGLGCHRDTAMAIPLFVMGGLAGGGVGALIGHAVTSEK